jgi:hypothetical protein
MRLTGRRDRFMLELRRRWQPDRRFGLSRRQPYTPQFEGQYELRQQHALALFARRRFGDAPRNTLRLTISLLLVDELLARLRRLAGEIHPGLRLRFVTAMNLQTWR